MENTHNTLMPEIEFESDWLNPFSYYEETQVSLEFEIEKSGFIPATKL